MSHCVHQVVWQGPSRQAPFAWAEAGQTFAIKELDFSLLMPKDIAVRFWHMLAFLSLKWEFTQLVSFSIRSVIPGWRARIRHYEEADSFECGSML